MLEQSAVACPTNQLATCGRRSSAALSLSKGLAGGLFLSWSIVVKLVRILLVGVIVMFGGLIFGGGIGLLRKELSSPMYSTWLGVP